MATTLSNSVLSKYLNPYFVETGTSNGDCVSMVLNYDFEKIYSIEINVLLQEGNKAKYKSFIEDKKLSLIIGDSLHELSSLIPNLDKPTTFWLDAHVDHGPKGEKLCPLYEELDAISKSKIKNHTILIDDLRILGTHWGTGISLDELTERIKKINPEYKFKLEDGIKPNDILAAYI